MGTEEIILYGGGFIALIMVLAQVQLFSIAKNMKEINAALKELLKGLKKK